MDQIKQALAQSDQAFLVMESYAGDNYTPLNAKGMTIDQQLQMLANFYGMPINEDGQDRIEVNGEIMPLPASYKPQNRYAQAGLNASHNIGRLSQETGTRLIQAINSDENLQSEIAQFYDRRGKAIVKSFDRANESTLSADNMVVHYPAEPMQPVGRRPVIRMQPGSTSEQLMGGFVLGVIAANRDVTRPQPDVGSAPYSSYYSNWKSRAEAAKDTYQSFAAIAQSVGNSTGVNLMRAAGIGSFNAAMPEAQANAVTSKLTGGMSPQESTEHEWSRARNIMPEPEAMQNIVPENTSPEPETAPAPDRDSFDAQLEASETPSMSMEEEPDPEAPDRTRSMIRMPTPGRK